MTTTNYYLYRFISFVQYTTLNILMIFDRLFFSWQSVRISMGSNEMQ
jgi:hypothetical protein